MEQTKLELYAVEKEEVKKGETKFTKLIKLYFGSDDLDSVYTMKLYTSKFNENLGDKGDYEPCSETTEKTNANVKEFFGCVLADIESKTGQEYDLFLNEDRLSAHMKEPSFREYVKPTTQDEGKSLTMKIIGGKITDKLVQVEFEDLKNPGTYYQKVEFYKPFDVEEENFGKKERKIARTEKIAKMGRMLDKKKYGYSTEKFNVTTFEKVIEELLGVEIIASVALYNGNPYIDFNKANVLKTIEEVKEENELGF